LKKKALLNRVPPLHFWERSPISRKGLIGSDKIWERGAALTSRLRSLKTEMLAEEEMLLAEGQVF
jgi:hypothetical protein